MQPDPFLRLAGHAIFALKFFRTATRGSIHCYPKTFVVVRMTERHDLLDGIHNTRPLGGTSTQQGAPVFTEKHLIVNDIPVPNSETGPCQRQIKPFFGADHLARCTLLLGNIAPGANAVALSIEVYRTAMHRIGKRGAVFATHMRLDGNFLTGFKNAADCIGHLWAIIVSDKIKCAHFCKIFCVVAGVDGKLCVPAHHPAVAFEHKKCTWQTLNRRV